MQKDVYILWSLLFLATIIIPLGGGLFLWISCRILGLRTVGYVRCWLAYLAAYFAASLMITLVAYGILSQPGNWATSLSGPTLVGFYFVGLLIHFLVVPPILRVKFWKAVAAQAMALVAYGIVLAIILTPFYFVQRAKAQRIMAVLDLRVLGDAMRRHAAEHDSLPANAIYDRRRQGWPLLSWRVKLLPYIGCPDLYDQFHLDEPWDSPHNIELLDKMPAVYRSPRDSADGTNTTYYQVLVTEERDYSSPRSVFVAGARHGSRFERITDGTAHTLLIVEGAKAVPWTKPEDITYAPNGPLPELGGPFPGMFNALFGDGHVRTIDCDIDEATLRAIITANGDEEIDYDAF